MEKKNDAIEKLADVIRENPGCIAVSDNDCWWLYERGFRQGDDDAEDRELASYRTLSGPDCGYGSGCSYGGDILQALDLIVGVEVESV